MKELLKLIEEQANRNLKFKGTDFTKEVIKRRKKYMQSKEDLLI